MAVVSLPSAAAALVAVVTLVPVSPIAATLMVPSKTLMVSVEAVPVWKETPVPVL